MEREKRKRITKTDKQTNQKKVIKIKNNNFSDREKRNFNKDNRKFDKEDRPFNRGERKSYNDRGSYNNREDRTFNRKDKSFNRDDRRFDRDERKFDREDRRKDKNDKRSFDRYDRRNDDRDRDNGKRIIKRVHKEEDEIRLNKYIANSGICSRREADELIKAGTVSVNGEIITQMGYKVKETDVVVYGGERLINQAKKYLLLNKPKGYITTLDDPQNRKTVQVLIMNACRERLYPVGRLDRNTTGLLLFTNDGDMTKKLTHPSFGAKKIYHVELNKGLSFADLQQIMNGITLDDGFIEVDDIQYVNKEEDKKVIGVELHSGKNRIVRRIFEHLGYDVVKLDRVFFAGLTKKNLKRGEYRFLTDKEVAFLKMLK
ncbi:MAG: rRNA pseudouridine synthase [Bacteroidales bacterium]|nr:rRNA pseudouridine synthase [Bacteroidales bacterium]